ncbi:hypothetical protein IF1G_05972 [Cordyceps javanica]|uniref:Uncharacterized protein n=1 Tax=Cordyceps javanica TaxID=43265 RepID=A0A545UZT2_9HYPO|nr:hypothetical protein IF1G_05972 [Cordyceps javanica]
MTSSLCPSQPSQSSQSSSSKPRCSPRQVATNQRNSATMSLVPRRGHGPAVPPRSTTLSVSPMLAPGTTLFHPQRLHHACMPAAAHASPHISGSIPQRVIVCQVAATGYWLNGPCQPSSPTLAPQSDDPGTIIWQPLSGHRFMLVPLTVKLFLFFSTGYTGKQHWPVSASSSVILFALRHRHRRATWYAASSISATSKYRVRIDATGMIACHPLAYWHLVIFATLTGTNLLQSHPHHRQAPPESQDNWLPVGR